MNVDVLGTPYEIVVDKSGFLESTNLDGAEKDYSKTILVRDIDGLLGRDDTPEEKEFRRKEVLRHEIIHAFFGESGLPGYSNDELLVSWLAVQFPKIYQAFVSVDAVPTGGMDSDG